MKAICIKNSFYSFYKDCNYNVIDMFEDRYFDVVQNKDIKTIIYVVEDEHKDEHKFGEEFFFIHFTTLKKQRKEKLKKISKFSISEKKIIN